MVGNQELEREGVFLYFFLERKIERNYWRLKVAKKSCSILQKQLFLSIVFLPLNHSLVKHSVSYFHKASYVSPFHVVNITVFLSVF